MTRYTRFWTLLAFATITAAAHAEVQISVTITGNLDEIIPILELLRDMGIGTDTLGDPGDSLRLNMHSVSTIEPGMTAAEPGFEAVSPAPVDLQPAEIALDPTPALSNLQFTPTPAPPDSKVLVTVVVNDPQKNVDTLVVQIPSVLEESFDLYDNGTHGDEIENDHIWSATLDVPANVTLGEHQATITAYNPHGDPVQGAEDTPLTIQGSLVIGR